MSSLAAARADNFYYPPDFDPQKHQTLNKYNGQHPLRERASKLDQGILVIRFEVPFNIWCEKCGEHIAKGERFNAEKKAIGQYYSTKILHFTMSHHCGCKITIQTDPKRAEYLVVEGARKKEESYSAADAEVIELPDEAERERRDRDPLYRLEYQQGAKAKALTAAERLAAIHDAADARAADPYSLNRVMRAALRGEKRSAAALEARREALGLPEAVPLLAPSDGDALAAEVAFLTSSARAEASSEARRKRILEQDIFTGGANEAAVAGSGPGSGPGTAQPPSKRPALSAVAPQSLKVRAAVPPMADAGELQMGRAAPALQPPPPPMPPAQHRQRAPPTFNIRQQPPQQGDQQPPDAPGSREAAGPPQSEDCGAARGREAPLQQASTMLTATVARVAPHLGRRGGDVGGASQTAMNSGRPPPGAAALAVAAARAASQAHAPGSAGHSAADKPQWVGLGSAGAAAPRPGAANGSGRLAGAVPGPPKRSLKERAAELQKRRQGQAGVGLALSRSEL